MIGVTDGLRIAAAAVHGDSGTLNLIPVGFAAGDHYDGVAVLGEVVFPALFECGSQKFYESIYRIDPGVGQIVRGCEMKQCHKRYN